MRNLILVTASALALSTAGIAVAHGFGGRTIASASATFTATTANNLETVSCTGSDGDAYAATRASYSGTAVDSSDPSLNGPLTFDATSLINTTTNYGTVSGRIQVGSGDSETDAQFTGVYANGTVVGLAQGRDHSSSQLVANISAGFSATGGFTSGLVGGGTSPGYAVKLAQGQCTSTPSQQPDKVRRSAQSRPFPRPRSRSPVSPVPSAQARHHSSRTSTSVTGLRSTAPSRTVRRRSTTSRLAAAMATTTARAETASGTAPTMTTTAIATALPARPRAWATSATSSPHTSKHPAPQRNQGNRKAPRPQSGRFSFPVRVKSWCAYGPEIAAIVSVLV